MCHCLSVPRSRKQPGGIGYRLWIGGPVPPGSDGITLGRLVMVRKRVANSPNFDHLLRHELAHVAQWADLGYTRYLVQYLRSYASGRLHGLSHHQAYLAIPLEVEARAKADRLPVDHPAVEVPAIHLAHRRLLDFAAALTDDEVRQPSLLPGWTVGHVLAHLALNAEATTRVAIAAVAGEAGHMYPSVEIREYDIDRLATEDAATLVDRLSTSSAAWEAAWSVVTPSVMSTGVASRVPGSDQFPINTVLMSRLREVEVHAADCGHRRYTYETWSNAYVSREFSQLFNDVHGRTADHVHLIDEYGHHHMIGEATQRPAIYATRRAMVAWMLSRRPVDGLPELTPWG